MFRRLTRHSVRRLVKIVGLVTLAGCCAVALPTRVYTRFDRVRIKVVTSPVQSVDGAVVVPISEATSLAGLPTALILQNDSPETRTIRIAVNRAELERVTLSPRQTLRVDLGVSVQPDAGQDGRIELVGDGDDWALQYLELANVHGFSSGLFSFVITPDDAALSDHPSGLAAGFFFGVFLVLSIPLFRLDAGRAIRVVSLLPGVIICCFLGATLVLPAVSAFKVLLSVQAFSVCMVALYGPPAASRLAIVYKAALFAQHQRKRPRPRREKATSPGESVSEVTGRGSAMQAFLHGLLDRNWQPLGAAVFASLIVGYAWVLFSNNSFSVGGSDSSGYLSFARMLSDGEMSREIDALDLFGLEPARFREVLTPLGWRNSPIPDRIVPVFRWASRYRCCSVRSCSGGRPVRSCSARSRLLSASG